MQCRVGARAWTFPVLVLLCAALSACAIVPPRTAVPAELAPQAAIPGMSDVRVWGDVPFSRALLAPELAKLKAKYATLPPNAKPPVSNLLALSGGADDGAFGAGLLVGWTQRGDRPQFDVVTGISAGALIAPFAFLGSAYDKQVAGLFTIYNPGDIYQANVLAGVLGGNALADSAPLARLIEHYVDARFMRRVAEERAKGRFLLIGTTNLDAQRPVFWDMGRIAQHGDPAALELFRKVLLASASFPGVFPPVRIPVLAKGGTFEEMHVDGGTTREVFFTVADFRYREIDVAIGRQVERHLWVIRNGKITPEYKEMPETALAIAARSLETLAKSRDISDLARMYARARSDNIDFNLAAIPPDFEAPHPRPFDQAYMRALYERGIELGRRGHPWLKRVPETFVQSRR